MLLVGIFSTHITYIILAIVYIFGYGTYALNLKKEQSQETETKKIISVDNTLSSEKLSNSFYYYANDCKECIKSTLKTSSKITISLPRFRQKFKLKNAINWTSYNTLLPNITRPSPSFS